MPKDKREATKRQLEGIIMINSNPISARWATHKLENNSTKGSPTVLNVLSPMSDFPSWGPGKEVMKPQGLWPWRPVGFDYRNPAGLGETETSFLMDTNKILWPWGPRRKEQWPHRRLNQTCLLVLEGKLIVGMGARQQQSWEVPLGVNPLGVCHYPYHSGI